MDLATYFGIAGMLANAIWPLATRRHYLLLGQVLACGLMFSHFFLLNAKTGALVMLIAGMQATLALPLEKHPRFKSIYLYSILLTPLLCWYTWGGWPSVLSSCALMIYCFANLHMDIVIMKRYLVLCILLWFAHNLLVESIPGLISNALALSTLLFSYLSSISGKNLFKK